MVCVCVCGEKVRVIPRVCGARGVAPKEEREGERCAGACGGFLFLARRAPLSFPVGGTLDPSPRVSPLVLAEGAGGGSNLAHTITKRWEGGWWRVVFGWGLSRGCKRKTPPPPHPRHLFPRLVPGRVKMDMRSQHENHETWRDGINTRRREAGRASPTSLWDGRTPLLVEEALFFSLTLYSSKVRPRVLSSLPSLSPSHECDTLPHRVLPHSL